MAGYINPREQQKAAKIRNLLKEVSLLKSKVISAVHKGHPFQELTEEIDVKVGEADKLSLELVEYLKENYPTSFNVYQDYIPEEYENYFTNILINNTEDGQNLSKIIKRYNDKLADCDILILKPISADKYYVIFNNNGKPSLVVNHLERIAMEDHFYEFMERVGLTLEAVNKLYDFPDNKSVENSIEFIWPNKVKTNQKLV